MVNLTRIYTRLGDDGMTHLADMTRTSKHDPRLVACAEVDEANCSIGLALALGGLPAEVVATLARVQNELFDVGADLSTPVIAEPPVPPLRVEPEYIARLEADCDHYNEALPALRSFILPGGSPAAAALHQARTISRRAERATWRALELHADTMSVPPARYLNRVSDLLFILTRVANQGRDVLWKPGGQR
ncbi:MAG: cob(I)yrinic acid a,c-diamide adenosyltransferase [Candidatus Nanopelagicales bacterium]